MLQLRKMILPFVEVDKFAEASNDNHYTVRSIYFDTPGYDFYYEKVEGIKNRKKVRLRGYDDEADDNTVFFEIKRKYAIPIVKYRAPVTFKDAQQMLQDRQINGSVLFKDTLPKGTENAERFFFQIFRNNLRPVVLVIYEREAYLSRFDSTVRITFDKNLRSKDYPAINELYREEHVKDTLADHFILEVKFNKSFPGWMNPVISQLSLNKQSASKYVMSIDANNIVDSVSKSKIYTRSNWYSS
jgi:hypothetical protein